MLKILIVDDVLEDAIFAERVLRRSKLLNPIQLLGSGDGCIRYFSGHRSLGSDCHACILFLDMTMHPIDGLSVLHALHEQNLGGDSLIVMLSGITDMKVIQRGYRLGARTFLSKPIKPDDVAEVLKSFSTKISVHDEPGGSVLHWVSTPLSQQSSDTELICKAALSELATT